MPLHIPPALRHRRFYYLWLGMLVSAAGSQMQWAALHWHIRILSDEPNPLALGGIGLARVLPIILFSVIGGPVADTLNRRWIVFISQVVMALVALALAVLTFFGSISIWSIYLLTAIQATAQAFDTPARQAMIPNLVVGPDLPNAFSLSNIAHKVGAIIGPALSGVIIATLGMEYTYFFNAISFVAVLIALLAMGKVTQDTSRAPGISLQSTLDGLRFVFNKPIIFSTMLLDFFATFFASANTMMPIVARDILKVGEIGYGWLSSAMSIGSLVAGLVVSQIHRLRKQGPIFLVSVLVFGVSTILFGLTGSFAGAMVVLMLMGASDTVSTIIRNTIRQLQTPDHMRGRMVSVNQLFFQGGPQLGEMEAGIVAQFFGVPIAIISGGIGCVLAVLWIWRRYPILAQYDADISASENS